MNESGKQDPESGRPGGGAGRKEKPGRSGVYPASAGAAPDDAVIRSPGEWGAGAGGEEGGSSEVHFTEEELQRLRESGTQEEKGGGSNPTEEP